ncbi:hypothetical protein L1049_001362 [Liquidambar formosana]|uniref:DOG1 domain-containing protein n=1 Tax=Liquidambar formosana TaxID=63359 RepID=A0AAP0NCP0_LIQFO
MSFYQFYQTWFEQLHHLVDQLSTAPNPPTTPDHHDSLLTLVHKVLTHYSDYYRIKQLAAHSDVLSLFSAPWFTSLERSLHWAAGWRPTTLFHLVLTQSSILFESRIVDILRGLRTGDLGDLSPTQFALLSDLQCETVREENAITDELSEWQDGASELLSLCSSSSPSPSVGSDLEGKIVRRDGDSSDDHLRSGADLEGKSDGW